MVIPVVMSFNFLCLVKTGLRYLAFSFSVFMGAYYRLDLPNQTKEILLSKHILESRRFSLALPFDKGIITFSLVHLPSLLLKLKTCDFYNLTKIA